MLQWAVIPLTFSILPDPDAVAHAAAERFMALAGEAIAARGQFVVALAGGSTPERLYRLLAERPVEWAKIVVFFSDDRLVALSEPASNAGLALRLLPLAQGRVFPLPVATYPEAAACAAAYEVAVIETLGSRPRFDLVLLGMGEDGHTASLFPGKPALTAPGWVTWSPPGVLPPPVNRVTFTFELINAAREVLFLVTGANKAPKVAAWRAGVGTVADLPVLGVHPTEGTGMVLLDAAAGG